MREMPMAALSGGMIERAYARKQVGLGVTNDETGIPYGQGA